LALDAALLSRCARGVGDGLRHARARARTHRIHRDPVLPEVACHDARQPGDAVLRRTVVRLPRVAEHAGRRGHRHDPAPALLAHAGRRVPGAVEGALQVHGDDGVPLRLVHVEEHAVAQDAGIVHENVDGAELAYGGIDDALGGTEVGDAVVARNRRPAASADRRADLGRYRTRRAASVDVAAAVVHAHARTLG